MTPDRTPDAATPENSAREGARGVPAILADGAEWLLHPGGILNEMDELRDRIDDHARLRGQVTMADVYDAAAVLISANYDLNPHELRDLILGAEPEGLVSAVSEALFGPEDGGRRTFTTWVASGLMANGIDPASVPTHLLGQVMHQLVACKRAVPLDEFVESAAAARKRAGFRAFAEAQARRKEEESQPKPPPVVLHGPGAP